MLKPAWRKPTYAARALTEQEWLIADSIGMGLRCSSRQAEFRMAERDYAGQPLLWWSMEGAAQYEAAMERLVAEARRFREHGAPRSWPTALSRFWYWVALRQQYEN